MLRILLCAGLLLALCSCDRAFTVNVLFPTAEGLQVGDPVVYRGFEIGHVTDVGLIPRPGAAGGVVRARVRLDSKHADLLYHEMDVVVEGRRFLGLSTRKQIRIHDNLIAHPTPIVSGDTLAGRAYLDYLSGSIGERITQTKATAGRELRDGVDHLLVYLEELRDHHAVRDMERWLEDLITSP